MPDRIHIQFTSVTTSSYFGLRIARPSFAVAGSSKATDENTHFTLIVAIDLGGCSLLQPRETETLSDFRTCLARFGPAAASSHY
jgi:hypothetical protein